MLWQTCTNHAFSYQLLLSYGSEASPSAKGIGQQMEQNAISKNDYFVGVHTYECFQAIGTYFSMEQSIC